MPLMTPSGPIQVPPRQRAQYGLMDSAVKLPELSWPAHLCDDPCADAFFYSPDCDKFIRWTVDAVDPLKVTFSTIDSTVVDWYVGDGSSAAGAPSGAVWTHTYPQAGRYYVEAIEPADDPLDRPKRRQIVSLQIGWPECGPCDEVSPLLLMTELFQSVGPVDEEAMRAAALRELEATKSKALEEAAWVGYGNCSPRLTAVGLPIVNENAVSGELQAMKVATAIGSIEEQLASSQGTIHMSVHAANVAFRDRLLVADNDQLWTTVGGNQVIAGAGYEGRVGPPSYTLPDGTVDTIDSRVGPGFSWIVGHSGPAYVWEGESRTEFSMDTGTNRAIATAEVEAAVLWSDCRQVGALADLSCD